MYQWKKFQGYVLYDIEWSWSEKSINFDIAKLFMFESHDWRWQQTEATYYSSTELHVRKRKYILLTFSAIMHGGGTVA